MKAILFMPILALSLYCSVEKPKDELAWFNKQVEAIKPKRDGINTSLLSRLGDPFIFLDKNKSEKKEKTTSQPTLIPSSKKAETDTAAKLEEVKKPSYKTLTLDAIINQSVLINGEWYRLNDTVQGYTIKSISLKSATLVKHQKELVLTTNTKNSTLKFKNK